MSDSCTPAQVSVRIIGKCKSMYIYMHRHKGPSNNTRLGCGVYRQQFHFTFPCSQSASLTPQACLAYCTFYTSWSIPVSSLLNVWFLRSHASRGVTEGGFQSRTQHAICQSETQLHQQHQSGRVSWRRRRDNRSRLLICEVFVCEVKFSLNP